MSPASPVGPPLPERLFSALLLLYPRQFRREYGGELLDFWRDDFARRRPGALTGVQFWRKIILDVATTAGRLHWRAWRGKPHQPPHSSAPRRSGQRFGDRMFNLLQTMKIAARRLRKEPGFSLVAIATMALGVGATAAVITLANAFFLRALPYPDANRLVYLNPVQGDQQLPASYPDYQDWQTHENTLDGIAVFRANPMTWSGSDGAVRLITQFVSPDYLRLLGATPAQGRFFGPDDDRVVNAHAVVIISHALWEGQFGRATDVVGSSVQLNNTPYTVVGVMEPGFVDPNAPQEGIDIWVPSMMWPAVDPQGVGSMQQRRRRMFGVLGRLDANVTFEAAQRDFVQIAARLAEEYPASNTGTDINLVTLREASFSTLQGPTLALMAGAAFLLLVGCINVASLLLVRATTRSRESAVRLALGASRGNLVGQAAAEGFWLTVLGAGVGVLLAGWILDGLVAIGGLTLPSFAQLTLDVPALLGVIAVSAVAAVGVSVLPGLTSARTDLRDHLASARGDTGGGRGATMRHALVMVEVAVTVVILVGSALMVRSFQTLHATDSGFDSERTLTALGDLPVARYGTDDRLVLSGSALLDRLNAIPGVERADIWSRRLPGQAGSFTTMVKRGQVVQSQRESIISRMHIVTPGAVERMGLELVTGRWLSDTDRANTERVALVGESLAETLWPGESPLGQSFRRWVPPESPAADTIPWIRVVGVVSDASFSGRTAPAGTLGAQPFDVYYSWWQAPQRQIVVLARTTGEPELLTSNVREAMREVDAEVPLYGFQTLEDVVRAEEELSRFQAVVMGGFGVFALMLSAIGLYGVLAYNVTRRSKEIGLRAALGANRRSITRLFVVQGMRLAAVGTVIGVAVAFAATRLVASLLFGIPATDLVSFLGAPAALLSMALVACYLPTRRALRLDPMVVLRED